MTKGHISPYFLMSSLLVSFAYTSNANADSAYGYFSCIAGTDENPISVHSTAILFEFDFEKGENYKEEPDREKLGDDAYTKLALEEVLKLSMGGERDYKSWFDRADAFKNQLENQFVEKFFNAVSTEAGTRCLVEGEYDQSLSAYTVAQGPYETAEETSSSAEHFRDKWSAIVKGEGKSPSSVTIDFLSGD